MLNRRRALIANSQQGGGGGDYVSGMSRHYDGINHGTDNTTWKDLIGNNDILLQTGSYAWDNNGLSLIGAFGQLQKTLRPTYVTMEICLKSPTSSSWKAVWLVTNDYSIVIQPNNVLQFGTNNNAAAHAVSIPNNEKVTVSIVRGANGTTVYVNGEIATEATKSRFSSTLYFNGYCFAFNNNLQYAYNGTIYSIRLYDTELSQTEIRQNYQVDRGRF